MQSQHLKEMVERDAWYGTGMTKVEVEGKSIEGLGNRNTADLAELCTLSRCRDRA